MNKGEIWLVEIPETNGHEQTGKRPVIIIADTQVNITIIVPFTSNIQALRFPYTIEVEPSKENGLTITSTALVFQLRAIDKKRLKSKIGKIENSVMRKTDKMLKDLLQIWKYTIKATGEDEIINKISENTGLDKDTIKKAIRFRKKEPVKNDKEDEIIEENTIAMQQVMQLDYISKVNGSVILRLG